MFGCYFFCFRLVADANRSFDDFSHTSYILMRDERPNSLDNSNSGNGSTLIDVIGSIIRIPVTSYLWFPIKTPSGFSIGTTLKTINFRSKTAIGWELAMKSIKPENQSVWWAFGGDAQSMQPTWQGCCAGCLISLTIDRYNRAHTHAGWVGLPWQTNEDEGSPGCERHRTTTIRTPKGSSMFWGEVIVKISALRCCWIKHRKKRYSEPHKSWPPFSEAGGFLRCQVGNALRPPPLACRENMAAIISRQARGGGRRALPTWQRRNPPASLKGGHDLCGSLYSLREDTYSSQDQLLSQHKSYS